MPWNKNYLKAILFTSNAWIREKLTYSSVYFLELPYAFSTGYLREFLLNNKSQNGQTILIDLHGWLSETMGDDGLGKYYRDEFNLTKHISTYGRGYLINWARMSLGNSNKVARTALIELPEVKSHEEVVNNKYAEKYIDATINMLKSIK